MTHTHDIDPGPAPKLLSGRGVKARIVVTSALILAVGAWLTPRVAQTPLSAPPELAAPLLEEQVQLRTASRPFVGVQEVAARLREHSVAIEMAAPAAVATGNDFAGPPSAAQAAGFGVFVSDTYVLTHNAALDGRSSVRLSTAQGRTADATVIAYEPSTGLVLLDAGQLGSPPVTLADEAPSPGMLAVAVGHRPGGDFAVPVFITGAEGNRYTVGATEGSLLSGMPIYNLDGELLAIAAPERIGVGAVPAGTAAQRLIARAAAGERLSSIGIAFQQLDGRLTHTFGEQGVVITDVVPGGPADSAGLQAGDVLLAIGEVDVDSAETATRALQAIAVGVPTSLRVSRNGRVRVLAVTPTVAYEVAALARASTDGDAAGVDARVLLPAQVLAGAGIPPAARVLSIDGRPASSIAQARRQLGAARNPMAVLLRHGDHRFFAAIEPIR
jgi:S1-C subfamily serine protease